MTTRLPLPEPLRGRSFSLEEARALGASRSRLRASDLVIPTRGVRVPWDAAPSPEATVRPLLDVIAGGVASFTTAARVWQFPLPLAFQDDFSVHVTRLPGRSRTERPGVVCHRMKLGPEDVVDFHGLAVTSPLRTWLDLSGVLFRDDLVAIGDHLVCAHPPDFPRPREPLFSIEDITEFLDRKHRVRGLPAAREALALVRVGADSVPETKLRLAVVDAGLPEPSLNHVIRRADGRAVAWPDQAFVEERVALQYDGGHHRSADQQANDNWRNRAVTDEDWDNVVVSARDVTQRGWDGVARFIGERLRLASARARRTGAARPRTATASQLSA
ncbi:hypothetical protein [Sinomonas atrocyanea]|uniref:hypothetical protein n=1 Tax=Sinomonas atrocyanea TaxID=37927 RepID=UPI003D983469